MSYSAGPSQCHYYIQPIQIISLCISVPILMLFSRWTWVSQYQNVSILVFNGDKDDGDGSDNCTAVRCAKPQSNHFYRQLNIQLFYRPDALPDAQPTLSLYQSTEGKISKLSQPHKTTATYNHRQYCKSTQEGTCCARNNSRATFCIGKLILHRDEQMVMVTCVSNQSIFTVLILLVG